VATERELAARRVRATFSEPQRRQRLVSLNALLRGDVRSWEFVRPPKRSAPAGRAGTRKWGFSGRAGDGQNGEDPSSLGVGETNGTGEMNRGSGNTSRTVEAKHQAGIEQQPSVSSRRSGGAQRSPIGSGGNGLLTLTRYEGPMCDRGNPCARLKERARGAPPQLERSGIRFSRTAAIILGLPDKDRSRRAAGKSRERSLDHLPRITQTAC
jgi:hypothetical protein